MRMRRAGLVVLAASLVAGCAPAQEGSSSSATDSDAAVVATALPDHAPDRFGFGSAASEARVAMWDIDVKPDGEGLPPGSGSVAEGRRVYESQCIACHGPTGTEGPNDRLVGTEPWGTEWPGSRAIGGYWPYASTLYDYTRKAMPQNAPGSLDADQVYAVIAYVLNLNGLVADDAVMDASSLPAVEMPARERFVADDRTGGTTIR